MTYLEEDKCQTLCQQTLRSEYVKDRQKKISSVWQTLCILADTFFIWRTLRVALIKKVSRHLADTHYMSDSLQENQQTLSRHYFLQSDSVWENQQTLGRHFLKNEFISLYDVAGT